MACSSANLRRSNLISASLIACDTLTSAMAWEASDSTADSAATSAPGGMVKPRAEKAASRVREEVLVVRYARSRARCHTSSNTDWSMPKGFVPLITPHSQSSGSVFRHWLIAGKYLSSQASASLLSRMISGEEFSPSSNSSLNFGAAPSDGLLDRKSTRLNSSHVTTSY